MFCRLPSLAACVRTCALDRLNRLQRHHFLFLDHFLVPQNCTKMDNRTCLDADHDQTKKEVAGLKVTDLAKPMESMESIQKDQDKKNDEMMKSTEALKQQLATL